jgi:hypothetical protein
LTLSTRHRQLGLAVMAEFRVQVRTGRLHFRRRVHRHRR